MQRGVWEAFLHEVGHAEPCGLFHLFHIGRLVGDDVLGIDDLEQVVVATLKRSWRFELTVCSPTSEFFIVGRSGSWVHVPSTEKQYSYLP